MATAADDDLDTKAPDSALAAAAVEASKCAEMGRKSRALHGTFEPSTVASPISRFVVVIIVLTLLLRVYIFFAVSVFARSLGGGGRPRDGV